MKSLFEVCVPRPDVLSGNIRESDFAADLAQVLAGAAPPEYGKADAFFANTHPTDGLRALLKNVLLRLAARGGDASSIFRLDTQYGGGKTHALIALSHAARGLPGVGNVAEFVDPALVPRDPVRVAAFDGENADPLNGRPLGDGVRAFTPWGEIAHSLGGKAGYESVRRSDEERVAPGAANLQALFGGKPALILLDELSVYLRKVKGRKDQDQLTPFLTALFKAVESSPGAAVVFTLAIGKGRATDAYAEENEWVLRKLDEADSVAARKATLLDPTAAHETAQVLRRRLFSSIDQAAAAEIVAAYRDLWLAQATRLPQARVNEDRAADLRNGFPFHPGLISTLTDKLATLHNFQRVRGMLRLLTQTVASVWKARPAGTYALHLHHLDPGILATRNEIVTRLELSAFDPAIRNDVASTEGAGSLAQQLDLSPYAGMPPYGSFVARTILWNSFAFNELLKGLSAEDLRLSVLAPGHDVGFIDDARTRFVASSAYLDDRPGANLRFLTEANLTNMIRRQEELVDLGEARGQLNDRIRTTFEKGELELVPFASGPYDVDDGVGTGRPFLALIGHDAATVRADALKVPDLVDRIFRQHGTQGGFRQLQNNLVFLVADDGLREEMKRKMVRRLALEAMRVPQRIGELAEHQQSKVHELYKTSETEVTLAIQQCYRHLFFPSKNLRIEGAGIDLGHVAFDIHSASEKPGAGQQQLMRALRDNAKVLRPEDPPPAPAYVRDHTPLKKGQITTADLRAEFRKDPRLPILLGEDPFVNLVRKGVADEAYVYRSGELLLGPGDPPAEIRVDPQSFVYTMAYAKSEGIWPRKPKTGTVDSGATTGTGGAGTGPTTKPSGPVAPPGAKTFRAEAPIREALSRIFEDARSAKVAKLAWLSLRLFDVGDAFKLLSAVKGVPAAARSMEMTASYETREESLVEIHFRGVPADAEPLKEFLDPQFRDAKEADLNVVYTLSFEGGLELGGDQPEKLAERLTKFATGAAFVEASASTAAAASLTAIAGGKP